MRYIYANGKDEVLKAMYKKRDELQREVSFYDDGLRKIANLKEGSFYELLYHNETTFFVQCRKLGRDHTEFWVLTCELTSEQVEHAHAIFRNKEHLSLMWQWVWETKPVDPKDAHLYVSHGWKTNRYLKLLKGEI